MFKERKRRRRGINEQSCCEGGDSIRIEGEERLRVGGRERISRREKKNMVVRFNFSY